MGTQREIQKLKVSNIEDVKSVKEELEKQCTVMKDDLNHFHQEMLDIMKNQVNKCSRMHGDVKRKNEVNEDVIEDELPSNKKKNDDYEERMNKRTDRHVKA